MIKNYFITLIYYLKIRYISYMWREGESGMKRRIVRFNHLGVSPVIAVILMVAITVVLSGLLWAMLQMQTAEPKAINISATHKEELFAWRITITGVSLYSLNVDDLVIKMVDRDGALTYQLSKLDAKPAPFMKGLSKIYAMTLNTSSVQDSTTGTDVDGNSAFKDYVGCYVAFVDEDGDNKVNEGDKFYVYKDYNGDGNEDISFHVKFKIYIEDELALSREF
jgi:flagellin-like protein